MQLKARIGVVTRNPFFCRLAVKESIVDAYTYLHLTQNGSGNGKVNTASSETQCGESCGSRLKLKRGSVKILYQHDIALDGVGLRVN